MQMTSLKDTVTLFMNCFDAGLESKEDAITQICNYVEEAYVQKGALEALPVEAVCDLNESYGITVDVTAGSLKDIKLEENIGRS